MAMVCVSEAKDILQVQGINSKGFGSVPKLVMQDDRLSIQAKAIYCYFCSFAGLGNTAFPKVEKIIKDLQVSKGTYYKHFKLLKDYGYIKTEQQHESGRLSHNIYTLMEVIPVKKELQSIKKRQALEESENLQGSKIRDTHALQSTEKQNVAKQNVALQSTEVCSIYNNNNIKNKQSINNNQVQSSLSCHKEPEQKEDGQNKTDTIDLGNYVRLIKQNIDYSSFLITRANDIELIDEMMWVILDTVLSETKTVRIGGEDKPKALVTGVLTKLTHENIDHAIDQFKSVTEKITKKKAYLLTLLYNCRLESKAHYTNLYESNKYN